MWSPSFSDVSIEINHFHQTFYLNFYSATAMLETLKVNHIAAFTKIQKVCWKASFTLLTFMLSVISVVESAFWYEYKHLPLQFTGLHTAQKTLSNKNSSERTLPPQNRKIRLHGFTFYSLNKTHKIQELESLHVLFLHVLTGFAQRNKILWKLSFSSSL